MAPAATAGCSLSQNANWEIIREVVLAPFHQAPLMVSPADSARCHTIAYSMSGAAPTCHRRRGLIVERTGYVESASHEGAAGIQLLRPNIPIDAASRKGVLPYHQVAMLLIGGDGGKQRIPQSRSQW